MYRGRGIELLGSGRVSMGALAITLATGALIAGVNGANDVSKGIATLVGAGLATERRAIAWGAAWTAVGGALGAVFSSALVTVFGRGLLAADVHATFAAALAAIVGAAAWVLIATRASLPVSTTHAIVGSLVGVAVFAYGPDGVQWNALGTKILVPLVASPVAAFLATAVALRLFAKRRAARVDCLCVEVTPTVSIHPAGTAALSLPAVRVTTGEQAACANQNAGALRVTVDCAHWATSAGISLARAMNDTPKIVALVLAAAAMISPTALSPSSAFVVVTAAMVVGSVAGGRRVTRLLARKLTVMDHSEGFSANAVSAVLVAAGATLGLPMSTTHVSAGGILGSTAGKENAVQRRTLRDVLLAWVVTAPGAAILGAATYGILWTVAR